MTSFAQLPRITQLRMAAVAVLKAVGTAAGANVFDEEQDDLTDAQMPCIVVTCLADRSASGGGMQAGPPTFDVTYRLHLQCFAVDADQQLAQVIAESLAQAARTALLSDPVYVRFLGPVSDIKEASGRQMRERRYVGWSGTEIATRPIPSGERYTPATTSPLAPDGTPGTLRTVTDALAVITGVIMLPGQGQEPAANLTQATTFTATGG